MPASFGNSDADLFRRMLDVNLMGVVHASRAVLAGMIARGFGRIVAVASTAGLKGYPYVTAYCAAKHGVIGFCKSLARELIGTGVLVNCLAPVITETDLLKEHTQAHIDSAKSKIPMGRFLKIEEIAAMTAWVASPECSFNTGAVFDLSGGRADY